MLFRTPSLGAEELAALARIDELRSQLRYYVAADPRRWLGTVRRVLAARAIQGSNTIGGFNVSVEDAVAAVEGGERQTSREEDWQAVVGYQRAMTYVLQLAHDPHFEYSAQLIRSLHYMMTEAFMAEASPGLWRPGPIWVHNDVTGEVVYEGPEAVEVPPLIDELVVALSVESEIPVLVRAAMAHLNLVMIHPFRDGNGRMSRILQSLVLSRDQILAPEFSSIEEYFGRSTPDYYAVLVEVGRSRWSPAGDARPWLRFCLVAHYVQASRVLRRVREAEVMWKECEELAHAHRLPDRVVTALFDAAIGLKVRNSSYRSAVRRALGREISIQVATGDLAAMVRAGLLFANGSRRGAFYTRAAPLEELWHRARSSRTEISTSGLFETTGDLLAGGPELPV
jgi:hypothetical protein